MPRDGPFLNIREGGFPRGFHRPPRGGMCVNAFVFLTRGPKLLVGRYAEHPAWEDLSGLDPARVRRYSAGWTVPGSHLKLGEHPLDAARRVVRDILGLADTPLTGPRVETEYEEHPDLKGLGAHYDITFYFDGALAGSSAPGAPAWYRELAFLDPRELPASAYAREHQDVVARWLMHRT